jgi:hypothetical protein
MYTVFILLIARAFIRIVPEVKVGDGRLLETIAFIRDENRS